MALVWGQLAQCSRPADYPLDCLIEQQYDDVSRIAQAIRWNNRLSVSVYVRVASVDGTDLLNATVAAGASGGPTSIPNPRRWNVDTDAPIITLSTSAALR